MVNLGRLIDKAKRNIKNARPHRLHPRPQPAINSKPSLAVFLFLPAEIWHIILSNLWWWDLRAISLANRRFYKYTEPLLYRSIGFNFNLHQRVIPLLRSFVQRPELGEFVREVSLFTVPVCSYTQWNSPKPLNRFELADVDQYLEAAWPESLSSWIPRLRTAETEVWGGLLLEYTPHVQRLCIGPMGLGSLLQSVDIAHKGACGSELSSQFRQLQELRIENISFSDEEPWLDMFTPWTESVVEKVHTLLCAPALSKYRGIMPDTLISLLVSGRETPFAFTELVLYMRTSTPLESLLSLTPDLEKFKYVHCWSMVTVFDCDSVYQALSRIKKTVETLTVTSLHYPPRGATLMHYYGRRVETQGQFGSLRECQRLRILVIPWLLLTDLNTHSREGLTAILPPNLESLLIVDFLHHSLHPEAWSDVCKRRDTMLEAFLLHCKSYTPHLHTITVKGSYNSWPEGQIRGMKALCADVGINLEVRRF
ncbi:hypothetical protein FQN50_006326 [Emmonsiellopsis sp. PD_5]|nr:hypothetical protein FQN50_006326 [Emmonsiellopsis sp. PD_5]